MLNLARSLSNNPAEGIADTDLLLSRRSSYATPKSPIHRSGEMFAEFSDAHDDSKSDEKLSKPLTPFTDKAEDV